MMKPNTRYFGLEVNQNSNPTDSAIIKVAKAIVYKNDVLCETKTDLAPGDLIEIEMNTPSY